MKKGLVSFCAVFLLFDAVGMKDSASFRSIEEVNSLFTKDSRMVNLQQDRVTFIGHKNCDVELLNLAKTLLSDITKCQNYIDNTLNADRGLKRKEKDLIYIRALKLISSAIGTLKNRVVDLEKISVDNDRAHTRVEVLDQISKL